MDNGASSYRRFLAGDNDALTEIIRDYSDGLTLYLTSIVKNICIAEELTEETFVRLVVKRPKFRGKASFRSWLYTIGRNAALDCLRKNSRLSDVPVDELYLPSDEECIEQRAVREEQRIHLRRALNELDNNYSQVLYLKYFGEFSNSEISSIMDISLRQTENLLYRAKTTLKNKLEKEGFVYEEL
ncbi:MAG: RNA polymerase sigma factor [Ruminococcus sp.]|jgi:RNA polymerase sigma-70 factor (ECF subfamily)|nr:RNA polymerase sigma factor [Ruminococcus sp.]